MDTKTKLAKALIIEIDGITLDKPLQELINTVNIIIRDAKQLSCLTLLDAYRIDNPIKVKKVSGE